MAALFPLAGSEEPPRDLIRLKSGREVAPSRLTPILTRELFEEAKGFLRKGKVDLGLENCQILKEYGKGEIVSQAISLIGMVNQAEYSSMVLLKNGQVYTGKVTAQLRPDYLGLQGQKVTSKLRTDYLGLEGQEEVPMGSLESLKADYMVGLSRISGFFYLTTLVEIRFRGGGSSGSTISKEIEIRVETKDGTSQTFIMGHDYMMLKEPDLKAQLEERTRNRVSKVLFYPLLDEKLKDVK